jgi:sRNA-binding regulator protein Hfq
MENKKENIIVTNNGIRIKGNVSAFSQYVTACLTPCDMLLC